MATPTTSIDALPVKTAPAGTELLIVQDAGVTKKTEINEMVALPSPALTAHLTDTDDAHDASAVSAVDAGNGINGTNVQTQLGQLSTLAKGSSDAAAAADAKIVAHMAAALDAHDASAISAIAGVLLTGGDVQSQLDEIDTILQAGGATGPEGPEGPAGPGVPTGGTAGQLLSKIDANDFSSQWITPLWLPLTGGKTTGTVSMVAAVEALRIARVGGVNEHIGFYNEDFSVRHGFIMGNVGDMKLNVAAGTIGLYPYNTLAMNLTNNSIICQPGFTLYADLLRTSGQARLASGSLAWGTGTAAAPNAFFNLYGAGVDSVNVGNRTGYIGQANSGVLNIKNDVADGWVRLDTETGVNAFINGGEIWRTIANALMIGKTGYNTWATVGGIEMWAASGQILQTSEVNGASYYSTHLAAADAAGIHYMRFVRTGSAILGSIAQVSTTGVAYNATSDIRLKTFTRDVDDDEALEKVRAMRPVHFTWNHAPDAGEQIGFFAQELINVAPEAVTVGEGEPGDEPDEEGNGGFVPWGTDVGKLVPRLVAAMQAMDNKFTAMKAEIAELRAGLAGQ